MLDKLLEDSAKNKFDAVIVYDYSRWSRDNLKSKQAIEIFKQNAIRFFCGGMEYNLFNPDHTHMLGVSVEGSEHTALKMQKASIEARIERAKRGMPASRPLPSGRTYENGVWDIDEEYCDKIQSAANDFISGESFNSVAKKIGMSRSNLRRILLEKSGATYIQSFCNPKFKIDESVSTPIPRLLEDDVIEAVKTRFKENRTVGHGQSKYKYLLGRMLICQDCGFAFVGWTDKKKRKQYYRHPRLGCKNLSQKSLLAEPLEKAILLHIFSMFGDKVAIEKAALDAVPNLDELNRLKSKKELYNKELKSIDIKINRLLDKVEEDLITTDEIKKRMTKHRVRKEHIEKEIKSIESRLDSIPSNVELEKKAKIMTGLRQKYFATFHHLNKMLFSNKRHLLQAVFSGKTADGGRLGVYLKRGETHWIYTIKGVLIDAHGYVPNQTEDQLDYGKNLLGYSHDDDLDRLREYIGKPLQKSLGI